MPALKRPAQAEKLELPPRRATRAARVDVVVAGGGPAGIGAAVGAAEAGARVALVERYGFLGGNATAALVMPLMSFHTQRHHREKRGDTSLLPTDHGEGDPVIAGVLQRLVLQLVQVGGAIAPSIDTGYTVPFDPEAFKSVALNLLDEAGVEFLFHAFASDALVEKGRVRGVVLETKSGPLVIEADVVIDCTGDADVAARAGAPCEIGRAEDGLTQPMTLMARIGDFDRNQFAAYVREHPGQWRGVHGLWDLVKQATEAGELKMPREDVLFFATPHENEVSLNSTRINRLLGTDVWDLTRAELVARRQLRMIEKFLRKRVPGFERSYVVQSGVQVGVRETRRIVGDYQLTVDDILGARKFDDVIARGTYPVDIHSPTGKGTVLKHLPPGEAYDIPLRSLLPQGVEGILVAGRAISGTHEAHSSYRVMPISVATGQGAGVCAALAVRRSVAPRAVDVREVHTELRRQGASLEWPPRRVAA
ncbi:MAG TPA: FAD-dependent oxidoreductase [Verrucomicrobiae bacterium]|nr:FAD-dependent oxidoreductase [Verrucomicrobiae bacterium]